MEEILYKYFGDKKTKFYHPSDSIADDNFIRWSYFNGERGRILLSIGSNEVETNIRIFDDPTQLEDIIKLILF